LRKIVESIRRGGQWTKTAEEDSKEDKKRGGYGGQWKRSIKDGGR
jgi:hypothetical protein